jgi:DNA-binding LytR/AlgR family response regulator
MARRPRIQEQPAQQLPTDIALQQQLEAKRLEDEARLKARLRCFCFTQKQVSYKLDTDCIICAISTKQGVNLHTMQAGEYIVYKDINRTLASMEGLSAQGFLRVHHNAVLNMDHCIGMDLCTREVLLKHAVGIYLVVSVRYLVDYHAFMDRFGY